MAYVTYLRKSRADLDLEWLGGEDTLARHRRTLAELAERLHLSVTAVYEEVVSGDSIAARPQMQRLLQEIEAGCWEGVLVMEVERLARGDTMDQGLVANAFKYSGTKIVTPQKVYDPSSDIDEEYFEFSLFMSRREYKTINRRLKEGKRAAMREGKFTGSNPPFGYDKVRVQGGKGRTLIPNKDADTVRQMFDLFLREDYTLGHIGRWLNDQGITTSHGNRWSENSVKKIMQNHHYAGYTMNVRRPTEKVVRDGRVVRTRPLNTAPQYYKALHEPLVSEEDFRAAQEKMERQTRSRAPRVFGFQNPLNGLVYCDQCGRAMHRHYETSRGRESLKCPNPHCGTVMHSLPEVEKLLIDALRQWLTDVTASDAQPQQIAPQLDGLELRAERLLAARSSLEQREKRTYEFLEEGIYSKAEFQKRRAQLAAELEAVEANLASTAQEITAAKRLIESHAELVPRVMHVLDIYAATTDKEERNRLLKTVLRRATYHKTIRSTKKHAPSDLRIDIFPLLSDDL